MEDIFWLNQVRVDPHANMPSLAKAPSEQTFNKI